MGMSPRLLRPRASGGFKPTQIAGLELWLDGADSTSMTFNSTAVSEWRDKSGKGNKFTQSIAVTQPTFVASSRNGKSAVNFPNATNVTGPAGFSFAQPTTWFLAFQAPTSSGSWSLFDGDGNRQHIFGNAETQLFMFAGGAPLIATITMATWYVAVLVYNGASSTHRISTLTASTVNAGTNAISVPRIGANSGLRGDLGEIGMFSRAITDSEAESVLKYLSKKWAVTI